MAPLHRGHLTASPYETVEPPPGHWIFAARAVDTGGRLSAEDVRIVAELGPQRLGDALIWRCPASQGWPGTITAALRSDDGRDALEAPAAYTWDDLTTWDAWESWSAGKGAGAATGIAFATEPVDIGAALDVALRWAADSVGAVAFEYRIGRHRGGARGRGVDGLCARHHRRRALAPVALARHRRRGRGALPRPPVLVGACALGRAQAARSQYRRLDRARRRAGARCRSISAW